MTTNTAPLKVGEDTYPQPEHGWTCFHCGDTFTTPGSAKAHFGDEPSSEPACKIKKGLELGLLYEYRDMERAYRALQHKVGEETCEWQIERLQLLGQHQVELRREEEKGYARGLRDAGYTSPSPAEVSSEGVQEAFANFIVKHLGPSALAGDKMSLYEAATLAFGEGANWQASYQQSNPTDDDIAHHIACELASIDGYDPDDMHCGLYDLRWSGGSAPEPLGDTFSLEYLPKGHRIARALNQRLKDIK